MKELVSVIIPVFNIEDYIAKCIESVIRQTYTNVEIILIDDGSTDRSGEICKQYKGEDTRIKYVYQENRGLVGARKTGLICAKGNYIVFVDGDDYVDEDYVEKLYGMLLDNDVDMVHSNYYVNNEIQKYIKQVHLYKKNDLNFEFRTALLRDNVFEWNLEKEIIECNLYGCIYRKEVICDSYMELPDYQQYGEDLLCLCNLIMRCQSMLFVPFAYYHYVTRDGSLDHPKNVMKALSNKTSLYNELEETFERYKIATALSEKCQLFFLHRLFGDFERFPIEKIHVNEQFECVFIDLLLNKKIILYGAGKVGQSTYEQLTNYDSIEIVRWVDSNYEEVHSPYRHIENPEMVNNSGFDYIVVAVKDKDVAEKIADYLSERNVDRNRILWQPYLHSINVSMEV